MRASFSRKRESMSAKNNIPAHTLSMGPAFEPRESPLTLLSPSKLALASLTFKYPHPLADADGEETPELRAETRTSRLLKNPSGDGAKRI
jgi:hypothetical protein